MVLTDRLSKIGKLFRQEVYGRNSISLNVSSSQLYEAEVFKREESSLPNGDIVGYLDLSYKARFDGEGTGNSPLSSKGQINLLPLLTMN